MFLCTATAATAAGAAFTAHTAKCVFYCRASLLIVDPGAIVVRRKATSEVRRLTPGVSLLSVPDPVGVLAEAPFCYYVEMEMIVAL